MLDSIIGEHNLNIIERRNVNWCRQKLAILTNMVEKNKFLPKVLEDSFFKQIMLALEEKVSEWDNKVASQQAVCV
ncbi:hypothetical protein KJ786_03645 [Patescibacteria group bacterium]|nr:hypothetical protein [Patescibacteria group bacterium]